MTPKLLVVGCGRSGTGWAATLLSRLGWPCGHERRFNPWSEGPLDAHESSWLAVPHLDELPTARVLRVVRNPYDVVRSNLRRRFLADDRLDWPYESHVARHRPDIIDGDGGHLGRVIRYVALWDAPVPDAAVLRPDVSPPAAIATVVSELTGHPIGVDRVQRVTSRLGRIRVSRHVLHGEEPTNDEIAAHVGGRAIVERARHWGYT